MGGETSNPKLLASRLRHRKLLTGNLDGIASRLSKPRRGPNLLEGIQLSTLPISDNRTLSPLSNSYKNSWVWACALSG